MSSTFFSFSIYIENFLFPCFFCRDKDDKDKSSVKSSVGLDYSEDAPRAKSGRRLLTKQKRVHSVADKSSKVHTSFEVDPLLYFSCLLLNITKNYEYSIYSL
jgi:hypothetical protein